MKSKNGRMKRIEIERKILLCRPWQRRSRNGSLVEQSLQADSAIVTVMCCSLCSLNAQTAPITRYRLSICYACKKCTVNEQIHKNRNVNKGSAFNANLKTDLAFLWDAVAFFIFCLVDRRFAPRAA